jgi:NADH-quinone oxidoreductase subunit M
MFVPLVAWAIWIGIYPKPYFDILRQPVAEIVQRVRPGYFNGAVQNAGTLPAARPAARPATPAVAHVPAAPAGDAQ